MRSRWEAVLLYLLEVGSVVDEEPKEEATQRGISEGLGIPLPHLPRIIAPLLSEGLLRCEKEHVKGRRRRVFVYRLTLQGLKRARELWAEVMDEVVEVGGEKIRLGEVRSRYPTYEGPLSPLLLGGGIPEKRRAMGEEPSLQRPPPWYLRVRGEVLDELRDGLHVAVEPWEVPYIAGMLVHHGGFEPAGYERGLWHLRRGEISVVVGAGEKVKGFKFWTPKKPPVERWIRAFPRLSEILKPLYRISGGDVGVLKFLEGREEEALKCTSERPPRDCALMLYLKYTSSKEGMGGGEAQGE